MDSGGWTAPKYQMNCLPTLPSQMWCPVHKEDMWSIAYLHLCPNSLKDTVENKAGLVTYATFYVNLKSALSSCFLRVCLIETSGCMHYNTVCYNEQSFNYYIKGGQITNQKWICLTDLACRTGFDQHVYYQSVTWTTAVLDLKAKEHFQYLQQHLKP